MDAYDRVRTEDALPQLMMVDGAVLRIFEVTGFDQVIARFSTLDSALTAGSAADSDPDGSGRSPPIGSVLVGAEVADPCSPAAWPEAIAVQDAAPRSGWLPGWQESAPLSPWSTPYRPRRGIASIVPSSREYRPQHDRGLRAAEDRFHRIGQRDRVILQRLRIHHHGDRIGDAAVAAAGKASSLASIKAVGQPSIQQDARRAHYADVLRDMPEC